MTYDPTKLTIEFLAKPSVQPEGTLVRFRAALEGSSPELEKRQEFELMLGATDVPEVLAVCFANAEVWAKSFEELETPKEVDVPVGVSIAATQEALAAEVSAAEERAAERRAALGE
jgi:hypothetical protein